MLGGCDTASSPLAVSVSSGLLGVAEGFGGLQIVSVMNPYNPVVLGTFSTYDMVQDVAMVGNLAYVAASTAGLQIIDISDPAHPVWVGNFTTNMSAFAVRVVGHYAFVGCPAALALTNKPMGLGLQIIDVSNPAQPVLLGTTSRGANAVAVLGNMALTVGLNSGLSLFDVGNPTAPVLVGTYYATRQFPPFPSSAGNDIQAVGNFAYLAGGTNGLWMVGVSNPSSPVDLGIFATSGSAQRLAVVGNLAYVAQGDGGLQIIELPSNIGVQPSPALSLLRQNGLKLQLNGSAGAQFSVEHTDDLIQSPWQLLQTITLSNAPATLDVSSPGIGQHFFRARYLLP
jgi:hypothetical protein